MMTLMNNTAAMDDIGYSYEHGHGVKKDIPIAINLVEKSCGAGQ